MTALARSQPCRGSPWRSSPVTSSGSTAHGQIDDDSYWPGFADGELHQQLNDRTPSAN
jgi:hypothetical protein